MVTPVMITPLNNNIMVLYKLYIIYCLKQTNNFYMYGIEYIIHLYIPENISWLFTDQ